MITGSLTEAQYKADLINGMATIGLRVFFSPNAFVKGPGGLAGTDQQRASDLMWAFQNPNVSGIIANRGGWGCNRILPMLDYSIIRQNPKVLMGFSDLTGCLNAITTQTGLVTFHGPMGVNNWKNTLNAAHFKEVAMSASFNRPMVSKTPVTTITHGIAQGKLIGGNLSVFNAMAGSVYFPPTDEPYILFLEDVSEATYVMDRYLTQLDNAGVFRKAAGLVFGQCTTCPVNGDFTMLQLLQQKWGSLNDIPSFMGAMTGHIAEQFTLPIGSHVSINATAGTITLMEPAVSP